MKTNLLQLSILIITTTFTVLSSCSSSASIEQEKLEGLWILKSINTASAFDKFFGNIPSLEFDIDKQEFYGTAGCNRFNSKYVIEKNKLKISNLVSTDMNCIERNEETLFLQIISSQNGLNISLKDSILTLKETDEMILEFSKSK